jgi:SPP1 family predicted phage head-tail adaptor
MSVAIRAGELRHQVTLQQLGKRVDDGYGGGSIPEIDVVKLWAHIEPLVGRELFNEAQFNPSVTHQITIRYYPGIKPSMRILFGSRVFDIKSIRDIDERHRKIESICEELVTW